MALHPPPLAIRRSPGVQAGLLPLMRATYSHIVSMYVCTYVCTFVGRNVNVCIYIETVVHRVWKSVATVEVGIPKLAQVQIPCCLKLSHVGIQG